MTARKTIWLVWLVSLVAAIVQPLWAWGSLPETVASHFDIDGRPNGWMDRDRLIWIWLGVVALANLMIGLPRAALRRIPGLVSMPNAAYWTASEERRAFAGDVLTVVMVGVAACMNAILFLVFDGIAGQTADGTAAFPLVPFWTLLAVLVVFSIGYPYYALRVPRDR